MCAFVFIPIVAHAHSTVLDMADNFINTHKPDPDPPKVIKVDASSVP